MKTANIDNSTEKQLDLFTEQEVWKDIPGTQYQVSNYGNVVSWTRRSKGVLLIPSDNGRGYLTLGIFINCKRVSFKVHRLVAMAFLDNPDNLPQVNHKNGIKTDNRVENLEWCTNSYNQKEAHRLGLCNHILGQEHHMSKLSDKQVLDIKEKYTRVYGNMQKLALEYGVTNSCIWRIVNNINHNIAKLPNNTSV